MQASTVKIGSPFSCLRALCLGVLVVMLCAPRAVAQMDVIGAHDLSAGGSSPVKGTLSGSCLYCHAPHGGINGTGGVSSTPLWSQKLSSVQAYTVYSSGTLVNAPNPSPHLGTNTTLCLSCHDGTVAGSPGALVPYGNVPLTGQMNASDVFGTNLSAMHPVSFMLPLKSAPDLVASLTAKPPTTADQTGAVRLIHGNVECGSCHNPHVQNIDPNNPNFLVINNANGALCLACHTTVPSSTGMGLSNPQAAGQTAMHSTVASLGGNTTTSKPNPLAGWSTGIHATASNRVPSQVILQTTSTIAKNSANNKAQQSLGPYGTVGRNGCASCHAQHNSQGETLLRAANDQDCIVCHNGSSNTSPVIPSILAETVAPKYGHAFAPGNSPHLANEAALVNQNRHVTCVDCHNPHTANRVSSFTAAPGIRASQAQVTGISASDGKSLVGPAAYQYENCLRCHGTSTGKQVLPIYGYLPARAVTASDPLNVIPEFSQIATSSHPVFHTSNSVFPQPSLRTNMLNLDGRTVGRSMGMQILCTDCHNSDDNREFGGSGASGPHGSIFAHILARRYEFSRAPVPGQAITNLFPNPSLSAQGGASGGPYALCAKCHDLNQVVNNTSFSEHARHIQQDGFSCSVCHTAHGMGAQSGSISGERLVNFDLKVVAPNGGAPISYNRATNSCSLTCHNHVHQLRSASASRAIKH